jgi:hypothetical protein
MLIILVEYCAGSTTSKYSWKSCGGQSRAAGQSCACRKRLGAKRRRAPSRRIDRATRHRAEALAKKWGVLSHAVMIANAWLSASDYYRALAQACGVLFRGEIGPHEVTAPASLKSPRECLARGLLKEGARGGGWKLRPNAVEEVLTRLEPHHLSLASPDTLRQAVCGHFAGNLAAASVDGLHARFPGPERQSKARTLAAPAALLAPRGLWGCARPPGRARLPRAFACAHFHLPAGDRASRLRRLRSVAPGAFEACQAARSGCRASALHHPRAALPRGQYARPAHRGARAPRLSGGEARHQADPGSGRRRDDRDGRRLTLPGNVEVVVVPDLHPRTKPKALNYASPCGSRRGCGASSGP